RGQLRTSLQEDAEPAREQQQDRPEREGRVVGQRGRQQLDARPVEAVVEALGELPRRGGARAHSSGGSAHRIRLLVNACGRGTALPTRRPPRPADEARSRSPPGPPTAASPRTTPAATTAR